MLSRALKAFGIMLVVLALGNSARALVSATLTIDQSEISPAGAPNAGALTIAFQNTITGITYTETVPYGQLSTPDTIAAAFGAKFSADPIARVQETPSRLCTLHVCAKADHAVITFQLSGAAAFGPATITNTSTAGSVQTMASWTSVMTLISSVNPAAASQTVTLAATISAAGSTPTGTVTFLDGATPLASPIALSGGTASFSTPTLGVGSHHIVAKYSGDTNYLVSKAVIEQVIDTATISGIIPNVGASYTRVQISGSGFGTTPDVVMFGSVSAPIVAWSPTQITVLVPAGISTGQTNISIFSLGGPSTQFLVTVPLSCPVVP